MTIDTMILNNHILKRHYYETDGVSISIIKQNTDTSKGGGSSKNSSSDTAIDENMSYTEELSLQEHASTVGKCVLIDPGRRDLLYCRSEDRQKDNKKVYRYTRNQKAVETKSAKFRKLRQKHKPDGVKEAEAKLNVHNISILQIDKYKNYIKARVEVGYVLYKPENPLPFRKMKLSSYINQVQANKRLAYR
ncbi:hypothetical protein BD770DRAFT_437554 [Pilaira anomala]|nr:hypothetical protein BD770DRAFT_437554 [Pilaira anomala]